MLVVQPPPKLFKRLDRYIYKHGLRSLEVFDAIDQKQKKILSYDDLIEGFKYIDFKVVTMHYNVQTSYMSITFVS